jgi:lipopolysaccharide/colanic/teichoic acid biosynthesis glycosyltransferase
VFNVLIHGMSLIGNRPLPRENVERLERAGFPGWEQRFDSPAGISGIAQVAGKLSLLPEERLALEIGYSRQYQLGNIVRTDFIILFHTLRVIVRAWGLPHEEAARLVEARAEVKSRSRSAGG